MNTKFSHLAVATLLLLPIAASAQPPEPRKAASQAVEVPQEVAPEQVEVLPEQIIGVFVGAVFDNFNLTTAAQVVEVVIDGALHRTHAIGVLTA